MATEFNFSLEDTPGGLTHIAEVLGEAGINIEGGAGVRIAGKGLVTIVTEKPDEARKVLEKAGIAYEEEDVLLVSLRNRPGALATFTHKLSEEGVNLTSFYITMTGQQVIGADDLKKARKIAESIGIL